MLAVLPHFAASQLVVCIAPDSGFNMIDVGIDPSSVTSDQHVQGFDVARGRCKSGRSRAGRAARID